MVRIGYIFAFSLMVIVGKAQFSTTMGYQGAVSYETIDSLITHVQQDTLLINFWATWCAPCVEEMPLIESYRDRHPEVQTVLVSLDFKNHIDSKVIPYLEKNKLMKHLVYVLTDSNPNIWIPKIDKSWSGAIPATLVLVHGERFFYEGVFTSVKDIEKFTKFGEL